MSLLECLAAFTLSTILLIPPTWLLSRVNSHQAELESRLLLQQNTDRALELMSRAIHGAGYRSGRFQHALAVDPITIQKGGSARGFDAMVLTQDIPDQLGYDCMGNPLMPERTIKQKAYQRFYLEPSRQDSRTQTLMCQSVDRQGRLQQAEILNHVQSLKIDWVQTNALANHPEVSRTPTGFVAITLHVQPPAKQDRPSRPLQQTRYVTQRQPTPKP